MRGSAAATVPSARDQVDATGAEWRPDPAPRARWGRRLRRLWSVPWKWTLGALLTQTLFGAILVFGWLQRYGRRAAFRTWLRQAGRDGTGEGVSPEAAQLSWDHRHAPNWIVAQSRGGPTGARPGRLAGIGHSAALNLRLGIQGLANVLVLTLPGTVLMTLGWWAGWQNSFHKGYEHAHVGPAVSVLGILLFVSAILYVPMALTRQAVTGRWRDFWQWRTNWNVVRHGWAGCAVLALALALLNLGAMALKTWPYFMPQASMPPPAPWEAAPADAVVPVPAMDRTARDPGWEDLSEDEALGMLGRHYAFAGFYLFAALVMLRGFAGRVYAAAVVRAVQRGRLAEDQLGEDEWRALHALGLLRRGPAIRHSWWVRVVAWTASRAGRAVCAVAVFLLGLAFVAEVYVAEFLKHHPWVGFLNQPLLQVPWFRYVPAHLRDPWVEPVFTVLLLAGIGAVSWLAHALRRRGTRGEGPPSC